MTQFFGGKLLGINLDRKTDEALHPLGAHVHSDDGGKCFRYVQFLDAVTYIAGHVVCVAGTGWQVSNDASGGTTFAGLWPVGFVVGDVPTQNQYGWVQCGGIVSNAVAGSAAIVAGDLLMPDTEDGDVTEATAGTHENICAVALATIADNAAGAVLCAIRH